MPKNSVTKFINSHFADCVPGSAFTDEGYENLRTYFGNVVKGQPNVYDTPFAKGESTEELLSQWAAILESIKTSWPSLWEFENDLRAKVGPLSVMLPLNNRLEDVAHYWEDILLPSKPISDQAIKAVIGEFSQARGLRLRSKLATVDKMKKSTNSGSPFWTKKRNVVDQTRNSDVWTYTGRHPAVYQELPGYGGKSWNPQAPAVIGWRGQEGGSEPADVKQRVVWMFPFAVNLAELRVYQPLIERCQECGLIPAWISNEAVDREITKLFDSKGSEDLIVSTDFTRFDQHFNQDLQEAARTILKAILTPDRTSEKWLKDVFPAKYFIPLVWQVEREYFSKFEGQHGMGSGSGGTNADETLVHRALQYEAAQRAGVRLNPHSMCLGDDGIITYPGITVEDVVAVYEAHGQECNVSKQYAATQDCVYLRRWHHVNYRVDGICVGVYSTFRALGRLRYLERRMDEDMWSPEMVNLRYLSILENCKWHPLREEFVKFCMKRDKYRLGIDLPGFFDNIKELAKEAIDHMPDFLGYTKTLQGEGVEGIENWWIVKYLKSMS